MSMPGSSGSSLVRNDAWPPLNSRWKKTPNSRSTAWNVPLNCSAIVEARSSASARRSAIAFSRSARCSVRKRKRSPISPSSVAASGFTGSRAMSLRRSRCRSRSLLRVGGGAPELTLRGHEAALRVALLVDERAEPSVLFGDALLGRADLLVEGVAQPDERRPPLLARRRVEPGILRSFRRGRVGVDGHPLVALRRGERRERGRGRGFRGVAIGREPLPPPDELRALSLDGDGLRFAGPHEIADIRLAGRERVGGDLEPATLALGLRELRL